MQREIENGIGKKGGKERRRDSKKDIKRGGAGINTQGDEAGIKRGDKGEGNLVFSDLYEKSFLFLAFFGFVCYRVMCQILHSKHHRASLGL